MRLPGTRHNRVAEQ